MYQVREIAKDLFWVGAGNRRVALFENIYPVPNGMSYNSYLWTGAETVLVDTVDSSVLQQFLANIEFLLAGRKLDYVIVNHLEPDHSSALAEIVLRYPSVKIVTNSMAAQMMERFNCFDVKARLVTAAEDKPFKAGGREFHFVRAPMVHWPEVMVTYESTQKVLFSADAFGTFGALNGNVFADEVNFERDYLDDARRYYSNIVGKYGDQVQALLKKAEALDIALLCPLHGPVWRNNINWYVGKYQAWSSYTPEETALVVFYASIYGNTENAALLLASRLGQAGLRNIKMYDVSVTHFSYLISEAFRASHLVFASPTYNAGIFFNMECLLHALAEHNLKNRTAAFIENGSWALAAASLMKNILSPLKGMTFIEEVVSINSSVKESDVDNLDALADSLLDTMPPSCLSPRAASSAARPAAPLTAGAIDGSAFFKLSYGLYLLTAKDGNKDNGCIINTAVQLTDNPKRITIAVNKQNYTHNIILKTGEFNISVLSQDVSFKDIQNFGFQSGRTACKFTYLNEINRSANGLIYAPVFSNAFISCKVISTADYGTHTLFAADVTEAAALGNRPSVTYQYYFDNIKPKPQAAAKKGWVCKICGYIFEGEDLPADFICPLCKHGAADFEKLG